MAYEQLHGRELRRNYDLSSISRRVDAIWIVNGMCPTKKPSCFFNPHIDTPTAHGCTKVVVPVRTMKGIACFMKETCPRHARQFIIIWCGKQAAVPHMLG